MLMRSKISTHLAWFQDPEVKIQEEEEWSGGEWKGEASFRIELLNVDAADKELNLILLCMWWEYNLIETLLSMGCYNWTKLHFIWINDLTVAAGSDYKNHLLKSSDN